MMTQQEFFERTGIELNAEAYAEVERIYMATGNDLDKDAFCKLYKRLNKQGYDLAVWLMSAVEAKQSAIEKEEETIDQGRREKRETAEFLIGKAHAYNDTDFHNVAVSLVGDREVVLITLQLGLPLFEEDVEYLKEILAD